jgi:hypothetical protein|tara:strand:- start:762 stop:941 length:180 start_codon:yes stop_codon:yes gene_type:complete
MGVAVIFFIGFLVFGAVISSFIMAFGEQKPRRDYSEQSDSVDYDGGGNWGRIPPAKEKK